MNHDNETKRRPDASPEETAEEAKEAAETAEAAETVEAAEPAEESPAGKKDKKKPAKGKKKEKVSLKKALTSEKFKHGSAATALTVIFIAAVVLVNVIVGILGERFPSMNIDMTKNSDNSLSEDAAEVVDTVDEKTEILIMLDESTAKSNSNYQKVDAITARMAERNSNITVEYKDLDTEPGLLSEYDGLSSGSVLVRTEKRYRVVSSGDLFPSKYDENYNVIQYTNINGALASALSAVNADEMPLVAFDTGHSEMLDGSSFKSLLTDNNFDTVDFNLMTDEIPENTQIVVLAVPATDLAESEVEKLNAYLNDTTSALDRSLFVICYPGQGELPTLNSYLGEWGMSVTPSMVIEGDASCYVQSPDSIIATVSDSVDLDGDGSYGYILSPQTNPIELLWESRNSVQTFPLLTSSSQAYLYDVATQEEKTEETGTYNLAALGLKAVKSDEGSYYNATVIVAGSPYLFNSSFTGSSTYGNGSYLRDLAQYATGTTGSSTAIYSTPTESITYDITMSSAMTLSVGFIAFAIVIPLAFVVAGIVVFVRRRHL